AEAVFGAGSAGTDGISSLVKTCLGFDAVGFFVSDPRACSCRATSPRLWAKQVPLISIPPITIPKPSSIGTAVRILFITVVSFFSLGGLQSHFLVIARYP